MMRIRLRGTTYRLSWLAVFNRFSNGVLLGLGFIAAVLLVQCLFYFLCPAKQASAAEVSIPQEAYKYQRVLIRAAQAELGLDAPVALLAAQIHQESLWRADVISCVGAQGLAQFMPATARWLPAVAPHIGEPEPFNPAWAILALCTYDNWLFRRVDKAASACDHWAFALSAYNGGLKWVERDRALAFKSSLDGNRYWKNTELVNAGRSAANFKENRGYPQRIFELQRVYEAARWGPGVYCD